MKQVRSALLFAISGVLFGACFNPPEFSNNPAIEYKGVSFGKTADGEDELIVSLDFKDGNGDLGLSATDPLDADSPFHDVNFFANDNGTLYPLVPSLVPDFTGYTLAKAKKTPKNSFYEILEPSKTTGEIITVQSRNEGFPSLPPYTDPYKCAVYKESYLNKNDLPDTIFIYKDLKYLIKNKASVVDSLVRDGSPNTYWYAVVDYFYIQPNLGQYNMYVKFFVKQNDGSFVEYDFAEEFCETHNGRFPRLADNDRALEGEINYSMVSTGFQAIFGQKTLKLQVTIYDRALNTSNTIETPEFRLEEI
ncbi:MAG TPA: hypothetical protein VEW65_05820 [Chryseolinea sp.]|nr:hypothetical protein [Chryseolinea sp.]